VSTNEHLERCSFALVSFSLTEDIPSSTDREKSARSVLENENQCERVGKETHISGIAPRGAIWREIMPEQ